MVREVERWEPASLESAKIPIPLWGATSIKVKGSEAVGPIFNVKRENDFAANELKSDPLTTKKPEMGDKMIPYPLYSHMDPKHGFTGVGTPQSPCDVGGMPKNQYGPTYGFSDGKNGFVPDLPIGSKPANRPCPIINGPVWGVGTGSGKYAPMPTPKNTSELLMSGPVFPIPDHYSKYTTQNFGCSGSGLKVERPKELCGPGNRDIGDRNSAIIDPMGPKGMYIPEAKEIPHPAVPMSGPKMPGIQAENNYNVTPTRVPNAAARMEMPGPVYPGVSCENHYSEVQEVVHGELFHPLPLHGPNVSSKNCYNPEMEKQPGQLVMAGPKFVGVDDQCKYTPAIRKADTEGLIVMAGPCFRQTVHTSLYNESPTFFKGDRLMTTPIFPGVTAQNNFGPASMGF